MTGDEERPLVPPRSRWIVAGLSVVVALAGVAGLIELWRAPRVLRSLPDSLVAAGVYEAGPPTGNAFVGHCAIVAPAAGGSAKQAQILLEEHFRRAGWRFFDSPESEWVTSSGSRGDAIVDMGPLADYLDAHRDDVAAGRPPADMLRRADVEASVLACIEDFGHPLRQLK